MSAAEATLLAGIFAAVCAGIAGLTAQWIIKRTADRARAAQAAVDERKVNREDFDSITANLWKSIGQLEVQLAEERTARQQAERRATSAEARAGSAEASVRDLEARVTQLEDVLRSNNMPIPPRT